MKNKKTLLIISIIAIAVVAAGIVIYNTKQKKDEQLKVFSTQVESFKDLNNTYNIKNSKEYTDLLNKSQKALESNDLNQINLIEKTISNFKDKLAKENSQELETLISEIKKIDISKLKNKINFENQLNDINNLKADQNFKEAIQRAIQLKATIIKEKADFDVAEKKRLDEKAKAEKKAKEQAEEEKKYIKTGDQALALVKTYMQSRESYDDYIVFKNTGDMSAFPHGKVIDNMPVINEKKCFVITVIYEGGGELMFLVPSNSLPEIYEEVQGAQLNKVL